MAGVCRHTYSVHSTYVFFYQCYDIPVSGEAHCTLRPPFEEKKEFPRNFSKKEFPRNLKKVFPPKLNTDRKIPIPAVSDTGKYRYRKNDWNQHGIQL